MIFGCVIGAMLLQGPQQSSRLESRFQFESPCPGAPSVKIDTYGSGIGLASETARAKGWQARIMWIDATANIDRYNTPQKIHDLIRTIASSGFNTVVFDIKPISGQTVYPSSLAPKLTDWRGQHLPPDFDPVPPMIHECHLVHVSLIVSMNAFSEGHRLFKVGPGYQEPDQQTVLYVPKPTIRSAAGSFPLSSGIDKPEAGSITEYSTKSKTPASGGFWLALGPDGSVISTSDRWVESRPLAGVFLHGDGEAGDFLKASARSGSRLTFDTEASFAPIGTQTGGQIPLMMNPNDSKVQSHALSMIAEVLSKYMVDGVIYDDRLRYSGMDGDFSETSRSMFEEHVGRKLRWPDDVFRFTLSASYTRGVEPGPFYDAWMSWRAEQIKNYVQRVRRTVKSARPTASFGAYVGSWYGEYPALGHNYASPQASAGFWFDTPTYRQSGTAPFLDFLVVGCYYSTPTIFEAMRNGTSPGYTVEASGALCNRLVRDQSWTYAGIDCGMFTSNPEGLAKAVQAACASTQGVMVFDLSHGTEKLWPEFKKIFFDHAPAPHQVQGSAERLRAHRALVDTFHQPERPIIILSGASGTGQ